DLGQQRLGQSGVISAGAGNGLLVSAERTVYGSEFEDRFPSFLRQRHQTAHALQLREAVRVFVHGRCGPEILRTLHTEQIGRQRNGDMIRCYQGRSNDGAEIRADVDKDDVGAARLRRAGKHTPERRYDPGSAFLTVQTQWPLCGQLVLEARQREITGKQRSTTSHSCCRANSKPPSTPRPCSPATCEYPR